MVILRVHKFIIAGERYYFNFSYSTLKAVAREAKLSLNALLQQIEQDSEVMESILWTGLKSGMQIANAPLNFDSKEEFLASIDLVDFSNLTDLFNSSMPRVETATATKKK